MNQPAPAIPALLPRCGETTVTCTGSSGFWPPSASASGAARNRPLAAVAMAVAMAAAAARAVLAMGLSLPVGGGADLVRGRVPVGSTPT
jgi:hypothetical protein